MNEERKRLKESYDLALKVLLTMEGQIIEAMKKTEDKDVVKAWLSCIKTAVGITGHRGGARGFLTYMIETFLEKKLKEI